jgi:ssDNA-specific exonuclease RecJ
MGFESSVGSQALEAEIKRVVQVIEQYPETGRRVFQLVYDEFQKFLSTFLSGQGNASRFVSVAQQIEQKETLSVQYTIELRKLLDDVPVRDEVREFLFKVWVEVLAVASVKYGLKHE